MRKKPQPPVKRLTVSFGDVNTVSPKDSISKFFYFTTYSSFLRLKEELSIFFINGDYDNYDFESYFAELTAVVRAFLRQERKHDYFSSTFKNLFDKEDFYRIVSTYIETL